ncbi:MAG: molybdenum cofactor biosynthesis protein MoaE [Fimbriimonas ginsengisoli]|uniref:Molybdenum cofactor biosynthesis protein MoaE n=1 Tax=Fimbriimonas ginsengisoli TaxID=1005039 RepID=A0A931LTT7_FIMGI|nr:molybdenum cofactor biosynthesis protein MoaE [Fimbriimonas ginsengisoli]
MEPIVCLTAEPLDPEGLRRAVESKTLGGVVVFCGEVRSETGARTTSHLEYEAYPEMALAQMKAIGDEAIGRWHAQVALAHRIGTLKPGEIAVVTVAACVHRTEAFECCRFLIDRIKADVPIWKKEIGPDGAEWADGS